MISKLKKRRCTQFISLALVCTVLFVALTGVPGAQSGTIDSNNTKIDELKKKAQKITDENREREQRISEMRNDMMQSEAFIGAVEVQIGQIEAEIDAYKKLINAKQSSIDETRVEIERKEREILNAENRISQKQSEIDRLDTENNENIEKFGQLIAQMYMNSGGDTISLLTGSTSFYDVLVRSEMIRNIGEKNTEFLEELLTAIKKQEKAIAELEEDIIRHENEKAIYEEQRLTFEIELEQLNKERDAVAAEVNSRYNTLSELTAERDGLQILVNGLSSQVNSAVSELEDIQRRVDEMEAENKRIADFLNKVPEDRPIYSSSGFIWPLAPKWEITGNFGWYEVYGVGRPHNGVDFSGGGIGGAPIYAVQSGTVERVSDGGGWAGGYGNHVIINHGGGVATLYAHMVNGVAVYAGQEVKQGDILGYVGTTGYSTGNHLHFEVRINGTAVDPRGYI